MVPPRNLADALVTSYWKQLHPLYPFLQKSLFEQRYAQIWRDIGDGNVDDHRANRTWSDQMFNCILNLVFALGCQACPTIDTPERSEAGNIFYQRSKKYLDFECLNNGSVELVQALLLTGQYLQSTGMSGACWNVVGLAIRAAQGIGLHICLAPPPGGYIDQLEEETRKRIWGGCLLFDR